MKQAPRLPKKLWIGTYEVSLRLVPKTEPKLEGDADGIFLSDEDDRAILIPNNLDSRRRLEVLMHEITHAINWVGDIDEEEGAIEEEKIATQHGMLWSQFWLDNPRFEKWMVYILSKIRQERARADRDDAPPTAETISENTDAGH